MYQVLLLLLLLPVFFILLCICGCQEPADVPSENVEPVSEHMPAEEQSIDHALAELERSVRGILPWVAKLYDKDQKGFHLSVSAWDDPKYYFCAIEPTAQAISILSNSRTSDGKTLIEVMPDRMRKDLIEFFQSRQDPADGFFKDLDPKVSKNPRNLGRALGYSIGSLRRLGAVPLYPRPEGDRVTTNVPELSSVEAFRQYLESLNWDKPWGAGDHSATRASMADKLDEPLRSRILDTYWQYLDSKQSRQTGMWGNDPAKRDYQYVSGVMKITGAFARFKRPVPMADKIKDNVLWVIKNDRTHDYCWIRNPLSALKVVLPYCTEPLTDREKYEIIISTVRNHAHYRQPDGGFSRNHDGALTYEYEYDHALGKGLREGDTNATTQVMHTIRPWCYELAGRPVPPMSGADNFYEMLDY